MKKLMKILILSSIILMFSLSLVSATDNISDISSQTNNTNNNALTIYESSNITNVDNSSQISNIDDSKENYSYNNQINKSENINEDIKSKSPINSTEKNYINKYITTNNNVSKNNGNIIKSNNLNYNGPFYVSIDGNDNNDGSEGSPFRTIANAINHANAIGSESTIVIKKGTYKEHELHAVNNLVIIGENVTIDGENNYIFKSDKNLTVNGISFINSNSSNIGAIYTREGNITVINSKFINCSSDEYYGGAIYTESGNVNIINSTFNNIKSEYDGGAIYSYYGNVDIINSTFNNIKSVGYAGVIYTDYGNTSIINSKFNNISADEGGILYSDEGNLIIRNSEFNNIKSNYSGGSFYVYNGNISSVNSNFINITSKSDGGVFYSSGGIVYLVNSTFINNSAFRGGVVYTDYENSDVFAINSTFVNNHGDYAGGVVNSGNTIHVLNCSFINNSAPHGGALIATNDNNTVIDSTFINNHANDYGGALSFNNVTVSNSNFINNTASNGSAIFTNFANVTNSSFTNNVGKDGYSIVFLTNGTVTNSKIDKNQIKTFNYKFRNITYRSYTDDGYFTYCLEQHNHAPGNGSFVNDGLENVYNSNNIDVSEYLKILLYMYSDNITDYNKSSDLQNLIWTFADGDYLNSNNTLIQKVITLYNKGFRVNTTYNVKTLSNGTNVSMIFRNTLTGTNTQNILMIKFEPLSENLTVKKETLNPNISIGNLAGFNITVFNSGNTTLDNVFVNDSDFDSGLVYYGYKNTTNKWTFKDGKFILNSPLGPNEKADIIIIFNTSKTGVLVNNVSAGFNNLTLANSSNTTNVYNMSVIKISNNKTVVIGNIASFTIVVTNKGSLNLTDIYIIEHYYDGLTYLNFTGENWTKNENKFTYNGILAHGESTNFTVYFNTTKIGNYTNTIVAGSNEVNNITVKNTTEVTNNTNNNNKTNNTNNTNNRNNTNKVSNNTTVEYNNSNGSRTLGTSYGTGNPLYALFIVLAIITLIPIRRKK
ncbi:MAG: hypothetical protein ACI4VU_06695 [Methanobrevibacter sp.]